MATIMTIQNADFSANAIGYATPVPTGLRGWWYLGGLGGDTTAQALARTLKNLAFNSDTLAVLGAPTINTGYVHCTGSAGSFLTSIPEGVAGSLLCVARSGDTFAAGANRPAFVSSFGSDPNVPGVNVGAHLTVSGTTGAPQASVSLSAAYNNSGTTAQNGVGVVAIPDLSSWKFLATTYDGAGVKATYNQTSGTSNTVTVTGTRVPNSQNKFRLGSEQQPVNNGACDLAFAAIYDRALSAAEVAAIYAFVKTYLTGKQGITI